MTISIWRYSHFALAVSSSVFILLASISGIILAFQPISEQLKPYHSVNLNTISIAETIEAFNTNYTEVIDLKIDDNKFLSATVFTESGTNIEGYFNPKTAEYLGELITPSPFIQWVTNFHRSLFLKGIGRFFVGLSSFLLFLIASTGLVLICKRLGRLKHFFSKIIKDDYYQYWHVYLGRLSLLPIVIITITGTYLSLEQFDMLPKGEPFIALDTNLLEEGPLKAAHEFELFKNTKLSDVKSIEFPFSEDVEDHYTLHLSAKTVAVNQFTGAIIDEAEHSKMQFISKWSVLLHTGKGSILWSLILAIATASILFFIYSGFAIAIKRLNTKLKNNTSPQDAEYVVLVGSENGSTIQFANAFYKELLFHNKRCFIAEMNAFTNFPKLKRLIIFTATYGQGDPPTNAKLFLQKLKAHPKDLNIDYAIVGFGALAYPNFCQFAEDVDTALKAKFNRLLPLVKINDKSSEAFNRWVEQWNTEVNSNLKVVASVFNRSPKQLKTVKVVHRTQASNNPDHTFLLGLKLKSCQRISSGDLLAVYPENDHRERLYSIGKINGHIQLSVKLHQHGLGSGYLHSKRIGNTFKARVVKNPSFYFPKQAKQVIMVANGTGIAPFLGMLSSNTTIETCLYLGLRNKTSFELYQTQIESFIQTKKLTRFNLALSKDKTQHYVQDSIKKDAKFIAYSLENKGVIMICGSLNMCNEVLKLLEAITVEINKKALSYYQLRNQIKTDCY